MILKKFMLWIDYYFINLSMFEAIVFLLQGKKEEDDKYKR